MSEAAANDGNWRRGLRRQLVQALVWGAYVGLSLLQFNTLGGWHSGLLLIALCLGVGLWSGSELLRALALRHGWLRRGLAALASQVEWEQQPAMVFSLTWARGASHTL